MLYINEWGKIICSLANCTGGVQRPPIPQPRLSYCISIRSILIFTFPYQPTPSIHPSSSREEGPVSLVRQSSKRDNSNRKPLLCRQAAVYVATKTYGGHPQKKSWWGAGGKTLLGLEKTPTLAEVVLRSWARPVGGTGVGCCVGPWNVHTLGDDNQMADQLPFQSPEIESLGWT